MELDYQQLQIDSDNITIGWIYNISLCDIDHFLLEAFNYSDDPNNNIMENVVSYNSTNDKVTILLGEILSAMYIKVSAIDRNGLTCGTGIRPWYQLEKGRVSHTVIVYHS